MEMDLKSSGDFFCSKNKGHLSFIQFFSFQSKFGILLFSHFPKIGLEKEAIAQKGKNDHSLETGFRMVGTN